MPSKQTSIEDGAVFGATDTSAAKSMTTEQTVSKGPMESGSESCEGKVRGLDLTTCHKAGLLSSGSEGRGSEMK